MSTDKDFVSYLAAVRALQSDDPKVRRPAISMLLELARQDPGAVPAHAERALTEEFGPYAVSEGLSGCSAPIEAVNACDGDCRSCIWLWEDRPVPSFQHSSFIVADLDPVGETHHALAPAGEPLRAVLGERGAVVQPLARVPALGKGTTEKAGGCRLATRPFIQDAAPLGDSGARGDTKRPPPGGGTGLVETRDQPGHERLDRSSPCIAASKRMRTGGMALSGWRARMGHRSLSRHGDLASIIMEEIAKLARETAEAIVIRLGNISSEWGG